jgi:hypothetical protein
MKRFVVIATLRRGVLDPPEPLDAAFEEVELSPLAALNSDRVMWYPGFVGGHKMPQSGESKRHVDRLMQLARRVA